MDNNPALGNLERTGRPEHTGRQATGVLLVRLLVSEWMLLQMPLWFNEESHGRGHFC